MEINPRWFVNFNTCLLHFNQKCCHDTAYLTARPIARCCRMTCLTLYGHIKTAEQHNCISSVCFCLFLCLCFSVRFYCLSLCGFSHNSNKLIDWFWYTGRWWVGCYIWYSEEGPGWAAAQLSPLLAVPNVTAHLSTASVPTSYHSMWHYIASVGLL